MKNSMVILAALFWGFLVATAADPAAKDANYSAAVTLIKTKKYETAKKLLDEAAKDHPNSAAVQNALAYVAERQGRKNDAITHYQRTVAILLASSDPDLAGMKRLSKAKKALKRLAPSVDYLLTEALRIENDAKHYKGAGNGMACGICGG